MYRDIRVAHRRKALSVECPRCNAAIGSLCTTAPDRRCHTERVYAWYATNAPIPTPSECDALEPIRLALIRDDAASLVWALGSASANRVFQLRTADGYVGSFNGRTMELAIDRGLLVVVPGLARFSIQATARGIKWAQTTTPTTTSRNPSRQDSALIVDTLRP